MSWCCPLYLVSRQSKGMLIDKAAPSSILLLCSEVNEKRLSARGLSVTILALILTLPSTSPCLIIFPIQLIYTQSSSVVINSSISISFLLLILSDRVRGFLNSLSVAKYTLPRICLTSKSNSRIYTNYLIISAPGRLVVARFSYIISILTSVFRTK